MKKEVIIKRGFNEDNKEIVKSLSVTKRTDEHNPETDLESTFYYRVSEDSGIFFNNDGYAKFTWCHGNPIDYDNFHKDIVPLDWALSTFGFETVDDGDIWKKLLREDEEFASELTKRILYLIPISKEEYENNLKE